MPESSRLAAPAGCLIDRSRSLRFSFDGRAYDGFAGDTIASALAANGCWVLSRSFKYHRVRGPVSFAGHEANTLVQAGDEPNVWADLRPLREGDRIEAQNVFGSLRHDRASILGALGRFLPVGFYYRSFFGAQGSWDRWEPVIRALSGLGRVPLSAAGEREHDKQFIHCDVAIVGGGAAGLAAAAEAARTGAAVALIEQAPRLGGWLLYGRLQAERAQDARAREEWLTRLSLPPSVRVFTGATCTGVFDDNWLSVIAGERLYKVRAGRVVLANGSVEQLPVFGNNDLPGVVSATGAQRLIRLYGVRPGRRAVVIAADDEGAGAALDLRDAGCAVEAVLWIGDVAADGRFARAAQAVGLPVISGVSGLTARAGKGGAVAALEVELGKAGRRRFAVDLVVASAGHVPAWQLAAHAGSRVAYEKAMQNFVVASDRENVRLAGAICRTGDIESAARSGREAVLSGTPLPGTPLPGAKPAPPVPAVALPAWPHFDAGDAKAFVDFDEDLTPADLEETVRLGFDDMQLMKRFSTVGMGPSQGRHSALASVRIAAGATAKSFGVIGLATARPPAGVETLAHLAGRSFDPYRRTPLHALHLAAGACMMPAGAWQRPAYFGSERASIAAEVRAVRGNAGLFDVGTLGGLDIRGPQAAEFLERVYTGRYARQGIGGVRYALMTDEAGTIIDDGVAARLALHHFYVTTTSGNSDAIYRKMLWWNTQWRMRVDITNVTSAYCGMNLSGPQSRAILTPLMSGTDLGAEAFRYMQARVGCVAGIDDVRVVRVGFLGELGYELHAPARAAAHVWESVLAAGLARGLKPIGVEAQRVLRLEKGHIIVGQDTDGVTTPQEVGMEWAVAADKAFFVGQRALQVREREGSSRRLVCWRLEQAAIDQVAEGHLVLHGEEIVGNLTSVAASETAGALIGMAFARKEDAAPGSSITIKGFGGALLEAKVCKAPFYDPEGARQKP